MKDSRLVIFIIHFFCYSFTKNTKHFFLSIYYQKFNAWFQHSMCIYESSHFSVIHLFRLINFNFCQICYDNYCCFIIHIVGCSHKFKYWVLAVNRHFGETNMNVRSSRSHTIFRMVCPWVLLKCLLPLETVPLLHIFLVLLVSIYHSKHAKVFVFLKIISGDWKQGKGHHF